MINIKNSLKFVLFSICLFVSLPALSWGANLISIVIADTKDDDIGVDCESDYKKMLQLHRKIADYTGLHLIEVTFSGSAVTPESILEKIETIEAKADDVIFYYYTGHGYRTKEMGVNPPWPIYEFPETNQGLESALVMEKLEAKKPRFLLSINDCCNVFLLSHEEVPKVVRALKLESPFAQKPNNFKEKEKEKKVIKNYARLFLETRGFIKIASATPGEYSYTTEDKGAFGGKFTISFLKSFNKETASKKEASWFSILDKTEEYIDDDEQHPMTEIRIY